MDSKYIKIWSFEDAPEEYRELSRNGGDEDYTAFIPDGVDIPFFLDPENNGIGRFGICETEEHRVDDGTVLIGCHA